MIEMKQKIKSLFTTKKRRTVEKYLDEISMSGKTPLSRVRHELLFENKQKVARKAAGKRQKNSSTIKKDRVWAAYNRQFLFEDQKIRYAFYPALKESLGLIVVFHSIRGHVYLDHLKPWSCFDILAPLDDFGILKNEQLLSCGFWGTKDSPFVGRAVEGLIEQVLNETGHSFWFTMGGSLGGFGALYHGLLGNSNGMYIMTPQVDIERIAEREVRRGHSPNAYSAMLTKEENGMGPDILQLAASKEELPPLYLTQNLYDQMNPFAENAYKLLDIYNKKKGWYGMRIHPAIGHEVDTSQVEAEYLFISICLKNPDKRFIIQ